MRLFWLPAFVLFCVIVASHYVHRQIFGHHFSNCILTSVRRKLIMSEVGIGTRVINFLVDAILIFLISFALYKWWSFYVMYWSYKYFPLYLFFHATVFIFYTFFENILIRSSCKSVVFSKFTNLIGGRLAWNPILNRLFVRLAIVYMLLFHILG